MKQIKKLQHLKGMQLPRKQQRLITGGNPTWKYEDFGQTQMPGCDEEGDHAFGITDKNDKRHVDHFCWGLE